MGFEGCIKCDGLAVRLGLCADHYREWMDEVWEELLLEGGDRQCPPCWSGDHAAWREYQILARAANRKFRSHCTDCLPAFKNKSLAAGKCNRPETIFVMRRLENREPELVGLNRDFPLAFYRACRGRDGEIVHDAPRVAKSAALAIVRAQLAGREVEGLALPEDELMDGGLLPPLASMVSGELAAAVEQDAEREG